MRQRPREPEEMLPLTPAVLHIMLALVDGERHGYGIMQEIAQRSGGKMRMGPGTLYGSLKRMIEDGLIEESGERPDSALDDERRRYYRLNSFGQRVISAEIRRLEQIIQVAHAKHLVTNPETPGGA
jgi:DNA-binding PadR family transcriptional regulator